MRWKEDAMKYIRNNCSCCGNGIEFPSSGVGQTVECPHCGGDVVLKRVRDYRLLWVAGGVIGVLITIWVTKLTSHPAPCVAPVAPASEGVDYVIAPPVKIHIAPLPVSDPYARIMADQAIRANDIAESKASDEQLDSINVSAPDDYYQFQQDRYNRQQTYDLDEMTRIYQQQYNDSLMVPMPIDNGMDDNSHLRR